jgi:hypothetical protein
METRAIKIFKVLIIINFIFFFFSVPLSIVFGDELEWREKWYTKMNIFLGFLLIFLASVAAYLQIKSDDSVVSEIKGDKK